MKELAEFAFDHIQVLGGSVLAVSIGLFLLFASPRRPERYHR